MNSGDIARLAAVYTPQQVLQLAELFLSVEELIAHPSRAPLPLQNKIHSIPSRIEEEYITYLDEDWPEVLNNILPRCVCLFYRGNRDLLQKLHATFGIIGSRTVTEYGNKALYTLLRDLDLSSTPIVSGLAYGFDVMAHQYALKHNYPVIAVIGGGISEQVMYPREHWLLVQQIIKSKGIIVSEYSSSTKPQAYHFPLRNRIIAAFSDVLLVVQAGIKSGTLITAQLALEIGRDVATIPARLDEELFAGNIQLLQQGAQLISASDDLRQLLQLSKSDNAFQTTQDPILKALSNTKLTTEELSAVATLSIEHLLPRLTLHEIAGRIKCVNGLWQTL